MLHVQIHPFLVQTLSLSLCTRPSFSSRLPIRISLSLSLSRSRSRFSFGGLHARTHAHPREDQYKRGRSVGYRADTRSSGRRASPKKALTKPRQRGGSPLFAQQQSSFGGTPASTARVGKDNEEREPSRESMPRSQLDVVLRVRIGPHPSEKGCARWKRARTSFFLSFYFFFLFFSFLSLPTTLHDPFHVLNISGASTTKPCAQHGSPSLEKKKREITKKKKRIARSREIRSASSLVLLPSLAIKLMRLLFTGFLYRIRSFFRFYYTILCLSSVHRRPFCRPVFAATGSTEVEGDPRLFEYTRYAKCAKWRTRVLHLLKAISAKPPTKPFLLCHGSPLSLSLSRSISMRLSSNPLLGSLG